MASSELWHGTSEAIASQLEWEAALIIQSAQQDRAASRARMEPIKRAFDIVFSSCVLVAMIPMFLLVAMAIKLDSPGPVLYLSERIGKRGRAFHCVKFRTMAADAERRKGDPSVIRVGRWLRRYSIDELPQFWNVLRGEMSVVGPRPPLCDEVKEYKLSHLRRIEMTPGITGLWQVQGRHEPSFSSYVSLDAAYFENWSIWLDLNIILRTVAAKLAGTGV